MAPSTSPESFNFAFHQLPCQLTMSSSTMYRSSGMGSSLFILLLDDIYHIILL